jgi:heme/copper-type cytochrome/quinol oxidase subunit 3
MKVNNFNLLEISLLPLLLSYYIYLLLFSITLSIYNQLVILLLLYIIMDWICNVSIESNYIGKDIYIYIFISFNLYILSELFIFISIFYCYICTYIYTINNIQIILGYSKLGLSLFNLLLLVSSGFCISICLYSINYNNKWIYLLLSLLTCLLFSYIQKLEYLISSYTITDSIYGSYFYCLTGLHGLHMLLEEVILLLCLLKLLNKYTNNISLIVGSINLHFLDLCLLFIYFLVY